MTELKAQVNRLEAEVEEQRAHKQVAMVENEQLRMEVEGLLSASVAGVGAQIGLKEADSECKEFCPGGLSASPSSRGFSPAARAQAAELRFSQLKERHAELITSHADLMKKVNSHFVVCEENAKKLLTVNFESVQNADTVKLLSATKQEQDDLLRAKRQVENQLETLRQEKRNMVRYRQEQEAPSVGVQASLMCPLPSGQSAAAGSSAAEPGSPAAKGGGDGASQQPGKQGEGKTHPHQLSYWRIAGGLPLNLDFLCLRRDLRPAAAWQLCRQSGRCCCAPLERGMLRSPP